MSQKVRKTLIMIVMAALIICLMAASLTYTFTYGRYAGGKFDEESPYDDLIEFVGAREYTVRSPEELIQAIEDGYSNIKIADDAEEPFVITEGVTDVEANLVLNLNGKVVVRNSRNPMLDVQTNVSVVLVYDSKQTGAFYNPVGSSLMASGGSLTVGSGGYESGPRAEEYENGTAAGTLSPQPSDVAIFTRGGITSPDNVDRANPNQLSYQKIEASSGLVPKTTGRYYRKTAGSGYALVPKDTFLIYTVEENCFIGNGKPSGGVTFTKDQLYVNAEKETVEGVATVTASEFTTPLCNVASCDFYYYYPINGTAGTDENPQDYAVIYGYWDVMKLARDDGGAATALKDSGLIYPYGAVRMEKGEGIVRGGTFSNHFDAVNTYGIYAEGGTLSVSKNTTVDTTFTTGGDGVCIRVQSATGETTTTGEATTTGGSLTISGGEFSSEIGNTIEMSGGKMTVTAGKFTKSAARSDGNNQIANQTAIIDIEDGTLKIEGNSADSVKLTAGGAVTNPDDGTVTYSGTLENVFGIRAEGGTVTASGCTFNISGDYSAGVLSYNGTVNLDDNTDIKVTQSNEFTDTNNNNNILLTSAGVSSEGGTINLTGNVTIDSNGLGITARGVVNVTGGKSIVKTTRGTGIYVNNGKFTVSSVATISVESMVQSGFSWTTPPESETTNTPNIYNGVYVQGGSIASEGTLNVTHTGEASDGNAANHYSSYAVSVESGNVTLGSGAIAGKSAGGIYVSGGELTAGAVTVSAGGTVTDDIFTANAPTYAAGVLVETGTVTLSGAKIYSTALGVAVLGGNFTTEGTSSVTATRATGIYVQGGTVTNSGTLDVKSAISSDWENEGADFENASFKTSRFNGIFVNGGSLNSKGTLYVEHTGVENDALGSGDNENLKAQNAYYMFKTKSYAVRVEGTTGTTVEITSGSITNSVGGGVLVNGGAVTLGKEGEGAYTVDANKNSSGLTIETTGYGLEETNRVLIGSGAWNYRCTTTGGDAVKIDGGTLKVRGGQYQTAHGNGIFVRGAQAAEGDDYAVEISGGTFLGYNSVQYGENANLTGPAQSYGIKIIGGDVLVNGGTFGSSEVVSTNGSAFFMGLPDEEAKIKIEKGNFYSKNTDAVATFRYTDITFEDLSDNNQNINVSVTSEIDRAAVALQDDLLFSEDGRSSNVTINGGTYTANGFGVWYGCSQDNLIIQNGVFTGSNTSGLYFEVNPGSNAQLSGGTYYGPKNDVYWNDRFDYGNRAGRNAIDGNQNISYSSILKGTAATGYTEFDGKFSGSDAWIESGYTTQSTLQNIQDKGRMIFRTGWGAVSYPVSLVYRRIEIG